MPPVDAVAPCLDDEEEKVRELATAILGRMGSPAVPALVRALDEKQPLGVRRFAAQGLAQNGAGAAPAIEALCRALASSDEQLRWLSAFALGKVGKPAVSSLRRVVVSSVPEAVQAAADALGHVGPPAKEAVPDLKKLFSSPSSGVRLACAIALVKITGNPEDGLPFMTASLSGSDAGVRKETLERIGELRAAARRTAPAVLKCTQDHSAPARAAAALTLVRIGVDPEDAVPALTKLLADAEKDVRANAGIALHAIGSPAASALPALRPLEEDPDERVAAIAKAAVAKLEGREEPPPKNPWVGAQA